MHGIELQRAYSYCFHSEKVVVLFLFSNGDYSFFRLIISINKSYIYIYGSYYNSKIDLFIKKSKRKDEFVIKK